MSTLEPIDEKDLDLASKFGEVSKMPPETKETVTEKPAFVPEKEPVKEVISAEKDDAYGKILSKVQTQTQTPLPDEVKDDAKKTVEKQDAGSQIQHLVDLAQAKGVLHAVNVARHMEDNYVLDMFHDKLLSDELHEALVKKGLIEEA